MQSELATRRRVLLVIYQRYLNADRDWNRALSEATTWFPPSNPPYRWSIGDPGSPVRQRYEARERAIQQLEVARFKLEEARQRAAKRQQGAEAPRLLTMVRITRRDAQGERVHQAWLAPAHDQN